MIDFKGTIIQAFDYLSSIGSLAGYLSAFSVPKTAVLGKILEFYKRICISRWNP